MSLDRPLWVGNDQWPFAYTCACFTDWPEMVHNHEGVIQSVRMMVIENVSSS